MIATKNIYATIVAFYLAKYDKIAIEHLGYKSFSEAFTKCAEKLGANKIYIKLRRDEFDPVYKWRKGWYNRPMSKIISRTIDLFDQESESDMCALVWDILEHNKTKSWGPIVSRMLDKKQDAQSASFALRVMTGKRAETYFKEYHAQTGFPVSGALEDCTAEGCGYDFRIHSGSENFCVEVKGITDDYGGILLTEKEWKTAMICGGRYYLCIVRNLDSTPEFQFIRDPYNTLKVIKRSIQITQTTYSVSKEELIKNE